MCKGTLEDKLTNFIVDLGSSIIIIKNVPSQVCKQCGEVSYTTEIAKSLETLVNRVKALAGDISVFEYSKVVA